MVKFIKIQNIAGCYLDYIFICNLGNSLLYFEQKYVYKKKSMNKTFNIHKAIPQFNM